MVRHNEEIDRGTYFTSVELISLWQTDCIKTYNNVALSQTNDILRSRNKVRNKAASIRPVLIRILPPYTF